MAISPSLAPFFVIGVAGIISGGLVAALTRPAGWEHGAWAAAFLVLVVGVGQIGLAVGQAALGPRDPDPSRVAAELVTANAGAGLVIAGTLLPSPVATTVGSVSFAMALVLFARGTRGGRGFAWPRRCFLALLSVLAAGVPVGIALSWLRS